MFQNQTGPDYRKPDRKNRTGKPGPEFVRAKNRTGKTGPDEKTGKTGPEKPGGREKPEKPDRENREGNKKPEKPDRQNRAKQKPEKPDPHSPCMRMVRGRTWRPPRESGGNLGRAWQRGTNRRRSYSGRSGKYLGTSAQVYYQISRIEESEKPEEPGKPEKNGIV